MMATQPPVARWSSPQLRGARAMLDWSMLDLARAAAVSVSTIKRMEHGEAGSMAGEAGARVWDALHRAGVRAESDPARGHGLWLARS